MLNWDDVRLPPGAPAAACVDVGGTKLAVSVVDDSGVRARCSEPTVRSGDHLALARQVLRLIDHGCLTAGLERAWLGRVGVSACGPFVLEKGAVALAAPNLCGGLAGPARGLPNDWTSIPLQAPLEQVFAQVRIDNDCAAALQAERRWGALQDRGVPLANCAYVTWSTGIGTGLCVDGHVLRGKMGNAGHAGHQFVSDDVQALCGCGNVGDVEALVAGNAIARRFAALGYADAQALFDAVYAADRRAIERVDDLCLVMGRMLYNLIVTLDLERISLGGSVYWNHRDYLLPRLRQVLAGKLPVLTDGSQLVHAGLGQQVGDFAALALVV